MIGTRKKIICATDNVRAIWRPEYRSRTIATASTRVDADISPCRTRAPNSAANVCDPAAKMLAATKPVSVTSRMIRRP
jgi:hypothetical protein